MEDNKKNQIPANDNGGNAVVPTPAGGALTSLTALGTVLSRVAATSGRHSGLPIMLFKAREDGGTWMFGPKKTVPEADSRWAVNPYTFNYGYICFGNDNKVIREHLVPVSQPMPLITELPNTGFDWQEEWTFTMKCISGADAGVEVTHKGSTVGTIDATKGLIGAVGDRISGGLHDNKIVPIVCLGKKRISEQTVRLYPDARTGDHRLDVARRSGVGT
jgi:hypothetical protein